MIHIMIIINNIVIKLKKANSKKYNIVMRYFISYRI